MIKSIYSGKVLFIYLLLIFPFTILIFLIYIFIKHIRYDLLNYEFIVLTLFLLYIPLMLLFLVIQQYKVICITGNKIIIKKFVGLIRRTYNLKEVKRAEYSYRGSIVIFLEFCDGNQITIGPKEFSNFYELSQRINSEIERDTNIKHKIITPSFSIWLTIFFILMVLNIININN